MKRIFLGLCLSLLCHASYATSNFFKVSDIRTSIMPEGSLGFVFLPALLGIIIASLPCARLGALLAHKVNATNLRKGFAWVTLALGVRFIWINLNL